MSRTSQLDAVNVMLSCISEAPVTTLEGDPTGYVESALDVLLESQRFILEIGWSFNTEDKYPLNRNTDNEIPVPDNVLKVDVDNDWNTEIDPVQRGSRLYDRKNRTYAFDRNLTGTVVLFLPWDDLPQAFRVFVTTHAARAFQGRHLGSDTRYRFSDQDLLEARLAAERADTQVGDFNLQKNPEVARALYGRSWRY